MAQSNQSMFLCLCFRPVQTQKIEKGTDPKSVVCAFYKAGQCTKGDKCKFSHDLSVERKVEKRSMYVDMRDADENDTMDNWNDEKLKEVVEKKHGLEKRMPTTDIVRVIIFWRFVIVYAANIATVQLKHTRFSFSFSHNRFANIFWMRLKNRNTAGSGNVQTAKNVFIVMHCHKDTF